MVLAGGVAAAAGTVGFIMFSNHAIMCRKLKVHSVKLPESFRGFRILQLSDMHGDFPNWKMRKLLKTVKESEPDIVVVTGDVIDYTHRRHFTQMLEGLKIISGQYPTYYVTGNHEYMHSECVPMIREIERTQIQVLHDRSVELIRGGEVIRLYGLDDPYALYRGNVPKRYRTPALEYRETLIRQKVDQDTFTVLLAHRPEFFEEYAMAGYSLVLSGHAHGGQWRIFRRKGWMAPDQGWMPEYTYGTYEKVDTVMVVSRGLGNSNFPLRLLNRPEVIVIELDKDYC